MGTTILLCGNSEKEQLAARIGAAAKAFHKIRMASKQEPFMCYFSSDTWGDEWNGWWVLEELKRREVPFHRIHSEPAAGHTVDEVRRLLEVFPGSHTYVAATNRYHVPRVCFWIARMLKANKQQARVEFAAAQGGEHIRTYLREVRSWADVLIHGAQVY